MRIQGCNLYSYNNCIHYIKNAELKITFRLWVCLVSCLRDILVTLVHPYTNIFNLNAYESLIKKKPREGILTNSSWLKIKSNHCRLRKVDDFETQSELYICQYFYNVLLLQMPINTQFSKMTTSLQFEIHKIFLGMRSH